MSDLVALVSGAPNLYEGPSIGFSPGARPVLIPQRFD